jgi:hypothetical protein
MTRSLTRATCAGAAFAVAQGLAAAAAPDEHDAVRCALEIEEQGHETRLQAVAIAEKRLEGRYTLHLARQDPAGTVDLGQSGDFALMAGERGVLTEVVLSGRARDLTASLSVETDERKLRCPVVLNGIAIEEI